MKQTKQLPLLAIACIAALLFSCKKSDNTSSKTKLLVSGTWTLRTVEYQKNDGSWVSQTPTVYTLTFREDKSLTAVVGTQVSVKAWSTNDDFSQLNIVGTTGSGTALTVEELSSSTLKMSLPVTSSVYTRERDTFTH
jgi:hypothetical protein